MKFLTAILLALVASCASVPFVSYAQFEGVGDVRTDGNALVAFGNLRGEAGIFAKGSNFPVSLPFLVNTGEVYLYNHELGISKHQSVHAPLPSWVRELLPRAHQEGLEAALGVLLKFE